MRSASFLLAAVAMINVACGSHESTDIHKDDPKGNTNGPQGDGTNGSQAGSRLVPMTFGGNDGTKAFAGWFDKGLNKECSLERLGAFTICVPQDIYTVDAALLADSYKAANPSLFTDPSCKERKAIALDETTQCAQYGVIRITGAPSDFPGCRAPAYGLAAITPIPAGTKVYSYGVPAGGGQCCSCNEWTPKGRLKPYLIDKEISEADVGALKLVSGKIDIAK